MTIRTFSIAITITTLVCLSAWIAAGIFIDPESAGQRGLALFYFSLFLWVSGFFMLLGFHLRHLMKPDALPYPLLAVSARQAIILALGLDIFLILKGADTLNWLNGIFLAVAVIFIETYFLSANYSPR